MNEMICYLMQFITYYFSFIFLQPMRFQRRSNKLDNYVWKCVQCRIERSLRGNSFFSGSHFPLADIMNFIVTFAQGAKLHQLSFVTGMCLHSTVIDWCNFLRDVIKQYVFDEMQTLQMSGIIEVDESLFGRRVKFHRGNPNRGVKVRS